MKIFSKEQNNTGRQKEIDLLRGFVAIIIIVCHVGLYLGNNISSGLWTFCDIIGSEPAAPVLMVLMGISMIYSRRQSPKEMLKRGIILFVMGYALSVFRSILPLLILGNVDEWASIEAFFVVDILQFAGLTFMFVALLKKLKLPRFAILLVAIAMVIINQFIMLPESIPWESEVLTGIVNLFCPITSWSCFPFLTWFFFPALGLCFGELLIICNDKKKLYSILLPIGLVGTIYIYYQFYVLYPDYTTYYWGNNFYYMGIGNALLTVFFICFALSFWFFAEKVLPEFIKNFLNFLSKNLNAFYVISWLIIGALIHAQALCNWSVDTLLAIGLMVLLTIVCTCLTKLWTKAKNITP